MSSNAIKVGKLIYNTISSDSYLPSYVGTYEYVPSTYSYSYNMRVFPLVAPNDTQFPFIVYTKSNVYPVTQTKDGWLNDVVSFEISVCSDKYNEGIEVANLVRDAFENCIISTDELKIYDIHLVSNSEQFNSDTYIQSLYFNCEAE